jgi:glycine cleavage system aminomethyltransferase T
MPNAKRPIMIIIGDEGYYDHVGKDHAKMAHVKLGSADIKTTDIFQELKEKFSIYLIRKPYSSSYDKFIQKKWEDLIGKEHIAILPAADRVVDVIFGILAQEKNKVDYFKEEIEDRQRKDQVDTVYKSLKTIHAIPATVVDSGGKSVMHTHMKGSKTKRLLP